MKDFKMNKLFLKNCCFLALVNVILASCSSSNQVTYLHDSAKDSFYNIDYMKEV